MSSEVVTLQLHPETTRALFGRHAQNVANEGTQERHEEQDSLAVVGLAAVKSDARQRGRIYDSPMGSDQYGKKYR